MSFSSEVKQELLKQYSKARHCQLAELAAIVAMEGHIDENGSLYIYTDNSAVVEKYTMLIKKLFQLDVTRATTYTVKTWIKLWYEVYAEPRLREKPKIIT